MNSIDHIVLSVPDLNKSIQHFEDQLGIRPDYGGRHLTKGTQNALLHLGNKCYLEILAIDHENHEVTSPRWMGIDTVESPIVTRWALKSERLSEVSTILRAYNIELGEIDGGQRQQSNGQLLRWEMTLPSAHPQVEIMPFFVDWQHSDSHPTEQLEERCSLLKIKLTHPNPQKILPYFEQLNISFPVQQAETAKIEVSIQGPKGILKL